MNSPLLLNAAEALRHAGPLLAAEAATLGPRAAALWRVLWAALPLLAAAAHGVAALAASAFAPPRAAPGAQVSPPSGPGPGAGPGGRALDGPSAAVLLAALRDGGLLVAGCDALLRAPRASLAGQVGGRGRPARGGRGRAAAGWWDAP